MGLTIGDRNRRAWFLASLAVLGLVYSVVTTRIWMMNWIPLIPLMERAPIYRMLLGPFWFGIALAPITVAVVLLRLRSEQAIVAVVGFFVAMNVTQLVSEQLNVAVFLAFNTPFCLALQVPVWALTSIVVKLADRGR